VDVKNLFVVAGARVPPYTLLQAFLMFFLPAVQPLTGNTLEDSKIFLLLGTL
jgi:hypothetical protein